jgi:anoctamin-1
LVNSYADYREPPWAQSPDEVYSRTTYYWRLMVARLAFVVVFENVIVMLTSLMRVLIPDVPKKLRQQKRQHSYLTNELIMRHEFRDIKRLSSRLWFIINWQNLFLLRIFFLQIYCVLQKSHLFCWFWILYKISFCDTFQWVNEIIYNYLMNFYSLYKRFNE